MIKGMGANKTDKAIETASQAVGGHSTSHNHASFSKDEEKISSDLHSLKPFAIKPKRKHASFGNIKSNPLESLTGKNLMNGFNIIKKNLMLDATMDDEDEEMEEFNEHEFDDYDL